MDHDFHNSTLTIWKPSSMTKITYVLLFSKKSSPLIESGAQVVVPLGHLVQIGSCPNWLFQLSNHVLHVDFQHGVIFHFTRDPMKNKQN